MLRCTVFLALLFITCSLTSAQQTPQEAHARVYTNASEIQDWRTAITALHYLLLEAPENIAYQDSLALLYYRCGEVDACLNWCEKVLETRAEDQFLHQLAGMIKQQYRNPATALRHYEALYAQTQSPITRYQICAIQVQASQYSDAASNIESMLSNPESLTQSIYMEWENGNAMVPLQAALLNLRGELELAINKENLARKSFRQALKIAPDFKLPRLNLNAIQARHQQAFEEINGR